MKEKGLITYALPYSTFPYSLYDYQHNGEHTGEQLIETEEELREVFNTIIPTALKEERCLTIMDQWGQCLFHIDGGVLIFPDRDMFQTMVDNEIERLSW